MILTIKLVNNLADKFTNTTSISTLFAEHLSALANTINPEEIENLWQDIANRYSEPTRAYHTLVHLQQLFSQFRQIKDKLEQPSIIALALFYHDVIYEPTRADNELKSAEHASKVLKKYLKAEPLERIYKLIMMTANHQLTDKTDNDAEYLLDIDLSVLGATWPEYEQYAQSVRQEYAHVAEADYRLGRTKVLAGLLAHPKLYLTDFYYQHLEAQARANVQGEITWLAV